MNNKYGFSLLELMTVIAVMSVMASIAIPNFIAWQRSARLSNAARDLTSDLSMARMHAIKSYNPIGAGVKVLFADDGYSVFVDDNENNLLDAGEAVLRSKKYPAGILMRSTTFPDSRTVFARTGTVSSAGSVTLTRGSGSPVKVVVNFAGRIRIETV